jgi:hypothetical protein
VVAASAAAVSAAEAGGAVAASVSEVEVATLATAGAGTSARIDRSSIGVNFAHDPDRTTKSGASVGPAHLILFLETGINGGRFVSQPFRNVVDALD